MSRHAPALVLFVATAAATTLSACDDPGSTPPADDAQTDGSGDAGDGGDVADDVTDVEDGSGPEPDLRARVEADLSAWTSPGPDPTASVRAYVAAADDLIAGEAAEGIPGDFVLENDHARYLVGFGDRATGPCSYDGNVVDVELRNSEGWTRQGDVMGEICPLLNIGQTFAPEHVEIVSDGTDGTAILAVTGRSEILDFLNLKQMIGDYLPGLEIDFPVDPDRILPFSITAYYILRGGDESLRVVYALRNDGSEREHYALSHMMLSGSTGQYFNPLGGTGGFGYSGFSVAELSGNPTPYVAYVSQDSGYAILPDTDPELDGELPVAGVQIGISGALVITLGTSDIVQTVLSPASQIENTPGFFAVEPGGVATHAHQLIAGDGALTTMIDPIYASLGVETATVSGRVVDSNGNPDAGSRISLIDSEGRTFNQDVAAADGSWSASVPAGTYTVRARRGSLSSEQTAVVVAAGEALTLSDHTLPAPAVVTFRIETPDGSPTPGRITVLCDSECTGRPDATEVDTENLPPGGWERVIAIDESGTATAQLPAGSYRVVASRGMEWSIWPPDATVTGGAPLVVAAGDNVDVDAEIAHVLDTAGAISGDFHVHAMASTDSNVANAARVLSFVSDGVDVIVSTDHDAVADYAPTIAALGLQSQIVSVVGEEITTPNIGHINAFPIERPAGRRKGAPIDWTNGAEPNLTPADLFAAIDAQDGVQVVQVNHPTGSGTIGAMLGDPLTGQSFKDPALLRMPATPPDPATGDTGLWTDAFTAMEAMNGNDRGTFWYIFRWWATMVGRGFAPTITAVTDTHSIYGDLGGVPRSYVFTGPDGDEPSEMQLDAFATAVNAGRLVGTNGPFFDVELVHSDGSTASLGETLAAEDGSVTLRVHLQTAEWVRVSELLVFVNATDTVVLDPGQENRDPVPATRTIPIAWGPEHRVVVAGGALEHARLEQTIEVPLTLDADAWVSVVVTGDTEDASMYPVLRNPSTRPIAFSNALFADVDGGGYNTYPLAAARAERLLLDRSGAFDKIAPGAVLERRMATPSELFHLLHAGRCDHGAGDRAPSPSPATMRMLPASVWAPVAGDLHDGHGH